MEKWVNSDRYTVVNWRTEQFNELFNEGEDQDEIRAKAEQRYNVDQKKEIPTDSEILTRIKVERRILSRGIETRWPDATIQNMQGDIWGKGGKRC